MRSRLDGAPSLPIRSESDIALDARARQIASEQGVSLEEAMLLAQQEQAGDSGLRNLDVLPGDAPGTRRVWNPARRTYDTVGVPTDSGPRPNPQLGMPWGGGPAFSSEEERDAYHERSTLTPEQRQAMRDAGATEEEIADAQASQFDRDARRAGRGTHGGYAPVYVNGRVVMQPRAPTPGPEFTETHVAPGERARWSADPDPDYAVDGRAASPVDPRSPGSEDTAAAYEFAQDLIDGSVQDRLEVPVGRDGVSVAPGWRQGTANAATDNVAVGPRAANRDVPQSLRRPDLEERGYRAMFMEGPNGGEWVYALPESELAERRAKADADRKVRSRRRMETAAGVVGLPQAQGMSDDNLRDLIARNREAERQNRELQWRPRAMIRGGNAIGALALPGIGDAQQAAILGGPTPLAVEAAVGQRAAAMAQQAITGFLANNPAATEEQRRVAELLGLSREQELPVDAAAQVERRRSGGVLPGHSPAGRRKLRQIEEEVIGWWATPSEVDTAVEEAVAAGIPRQDAEQYFQRRRSEGRQPAAPADVAADQAPPLGPGSGSATGKY